MNDSEIRYLQDRACERVSEILEALNIEFSEKQDYLQFRCPCHNGDNDRSCYFATRSNHWRCVTRSCEKDSVSGSSSSIFGLVRGAIAKQTEKPCSFMNSVIFVSKVLNISTTQVPKETEEDIEINKIIKKHIVKAKKCESNNIKLYEVLPLLKKDTMYYPNRGVTQEIIDRYHISMCSDKNKMFYNRSFFPILDPSGKEVVGWSGRTILDKCLKCRFHHNKEMECPNKKISMFYEKWLHSKGFKKEKSLYNYWLSKYNISRTGTAIICESPGNVWAYEMAGIKNSVAIMGLSMSKTQRQLLQKAGALTLILTFDNDEKRRGQDAAEKLSEELNHYFRVINISIKDAKDIAEMSSDQIRESIGKVLTDSSKQFLIEDTLECINN